MSTPIIIAIIAAGLFILVGIAITMQTIDKNNKEKRRLEGALIARARNFEYMLEGFPEGFLNRDLQVLVCKCLTEVFSQLNQVKKNNKDYKLKLAKAQHLLSEYQAKPSNTTSATLTDLEQIREAQKMLTGLYNFISKLAASRRIDAKEAQIYGKQVRRLMVQTSIDALTQPTQEALKDGKIRLAIHYLHMTVAKLNKENEDGFYKDRIKHYSQRIEELEQQAERTTESEPIDTAWDNLDKADDTWKKKAVYD
ncbi:MAG: hypothetical protein WCY88_09015 [Spongiibacteraceae bacterium]